MPRAGWMALVWLLAATPALGDEAQELVRKACDDLAAHLPATWPSHVGRGADASLRVAGLENRSRLRDVDAAALTRVARQRLGRSPRLTVVDEAPALVLVGGVYGSGGTLWSAVVLCDVAQQTVLAVGVTEQPAPEASAALVASLEARAAEGWPVGLPLAPSGKPVLGLDGIKNLTRWRDLDTEALGFGLSAALVRSGVVELGVARRGDAMRAIAEVRDRGEGSPSRATRVGLLARGQLEGSDPVELSLTVVSTLDGQALAHVEAVVPHARPEAAPSPSPTARRSTGRSQGPRGGSARGGRRRPAPEASPATDAAPDAGAEAGSSSPLRPRPNPAPEVSGELGQIGRQIESGACEQAIVTCQALLEHDDPYLEGTLHRLLGDAYLASGEPEQAVDHYTHALERTPFPLTEAYAGRARARLAQARAQPDLAQAALDDAEAALQQRYDMEVLHLRAESRAALGDEAGAHADDRQALAEFERDYDPDYDSPDDEEPAWVGAARARTGIARGEAPDPVEPPTRPAYFHARRSAVIWSDAGDEVPLRVAYIQYQERAAWLVLLSADSQPDPVSEQPTLLPPGETCAVVMLRQEWTPGAREARPLDADSFAKTFAGRPDPLPEQAVVVVLRNQGAEPLPLTKLLDPASWDWPVVAGTGRVHVDANVHSPTGYPEVHLAVRLDVTLPGGGALRGGASAHIRSR